MRNEKSNLTYGTCKSTLWHILKLENFNKSIAVKIYFDFIFKGIHRNEGYKSFNIDSI